MLYKSLFLSYYEIRSMKKTKRRLLFVPLPGGGMEIIMIKLIASDLDGTLLQNGAQELSPRAIDLIHRLTRKGICFVASSGRQYVNELHLFDAIKDEISYIAENGSVCIHNGKVISRTFIEPELAQRILKKIKQDGKFDIVISQEDACFIEGTNPAFVNHIFNVLKNKTEIVDDICQVEGPILKIAICNMDDGPNMLNKYLKYLQELFGDEIKVVTSGNIWIDFITPGTNKGTALQSLLDVLHIRPEECIAFGDQYNDVEMLQLAGTSYSMKNAAPGMSRYSTYVTDSVEDVLESILKELSE